MSWTGTVRCSYCGDEGHNRRKCPTMIKEAEENPNSYSAREINFREANKKVRRCSYCKNTGHNKKTCEVRQFDSQLLAKLDEAYINNVIEEMKEKSLGPGAIIVFPQQEKSIYMLEEIDWTRVSLLGERMGGSLTQPWRSTIIQAMSKDGKTRRHYYELTELLKDAGPEHRQIIGLAPKLAEKYFKNLKVTINKELHKEFLDHYAASGISYFFSLRGIDKDHHRELFEEYKNAKNNT